MTRVILALSLACAVLAGWQTHRLREALARAEVAEARVTAFERAATIRAETDAKLRQQAADAAVLDFTLSKEAGADESLSDYLSSAAGRLWP